jgi:hypothetical protein
LAIKAAELAFAVPQVVAHRVTRMALASPKLSPRDRKEFERMVAEKNTAFGESWRAMATQAAVANQALAASFFQSLLSSRGQAMPEFRRYQPLSWALHFIGRSAEAKAIVEAAIKNAPHKNARESANAWLARLGA